MLIGQRFLCAAAVRERIRFKTKGQSSPPQLLYKTYTQLTRPTQSSRHSSSIALSISQTVVSNVFNESSPPLHLPNPLLCLHETTLPRPTPPAPHNNNNHALPPLHLRRPCPPTSKRCQQSRMGYFPPEARTHVANRPFHSSIQFDLILVSRQRPTPSS